MSNQKVNSETVFDVQDILKAVDLMEESFKGFSKTHLDLVLAMMQNQRKLQNEYKSLISTTNKLANSNSISSKEMETALKMLQKVTESAKNNKKASDEVKRGNEIVANSIKALKKEVRDNVNAYESLDLSTKEGQKSAEDYRKTIISLRAQVKASNDSLKAAKSATNGVVGSYDFLVKKNKALVTELKSLPLAGDRTSKSFQQVEKRADELRKQINQNTEQLKEFDKGIGRNFRNVGNYSSAFDTLTMGVTNYTNAFVGMIGVTLGVQGLIQLGELLFSITNEFRQARGEVERFKESFGDIDEATVRVKALEKTLGTDLKKTIETTNASIVNFGGNFDENMSIIEQSLIRTSKRDEFLDGLAEYAPLAKEAGLSLKQYANTVLAAEGQGVFNAFDKVPDFVKESEIAISGLDERLKKAISEGLGEDFANSLFSGVENGSISASEGISMLSKALRNNELTVKQQQDIISALGSQAEDLGFEFVKTFDQYLDGTKDALSATTEFEKSQQKLLELNKEVAGVQNEISKELSSGAGNLQELSAQAQKFGFEILLVLIKEIKNVFATTQENLEPLINLISDLMRAFGATEGELISVRDAIKLAFDVSPIGQAFNAIEAVTNVIGTLAKGFTNAGKIISSFFDSNIDSWELIKDVALEAINTINDSLSNLTGGMVNFSSTIDSFFGESTEKVAKAEGTIKDTVLKIREETFDIINRQKIKEQEEQLKQAEAARKIEEEEAKKQQETQRKAYEQQARQAEQAAKRQQEMNARNGEKLLKLQREYTNLLIEEQIIANEKLIEADGTSLDQRLDIRKENLNLELEILKNSLNAQIDAIRSKGESEEIINQSIANATLEYERQKQDIIQKSIEDEQAIRDSFKEKRFADIDEQANIERLQDAKTFAEKEALIEQEFQKKIEALREEGLSQEEFTARLIQEQQKRADAEVEIDAEKKEKLLEQQIEDLELKLEVDNEDAIERLEIDAELAEKRNELEEFITERKLDEEEKRRLANQMVTDEYLENLEKQKAKAISTMDAINTAVGIGFDFRSIGIEQESRKLQEAREKELSDTELTEEEKERINAKFDEKERQLKIKQAKRERDKNIFESIINTARAVTASLPNIPLSISVGVAGAAQTALIVARGIPAFKDGHENLQLEGAPPGVDTIPALFERRIPILVSKGERIVPEDTNSKLLALGVTNENLSDFAEKALLYEKQNDVIGSNNVLVQHGITKKEFAEVMSAYKSEINVYGVDRLYVKRENERIEYIDGKMSN